MEPLFYSLDAVLPLVLMCAAGYLLKRLGVITEDWATMANKLNFRCFLPVLLFINIYEAEGIGGIDWGLGGFVSAGIMLAFALGWVIVKLFVPDRRQKGVVWQTAFRSNFTLLGMPLALALYGTTAGQAVASLSILAIPLFNVLTVTVFQLYNDKQKKDIKKKSHSETVKKIITGVLKNPLIIGIAAGIISLIIRGIFQDAGIAFRVKDIKFLYSALSGLSQVASPLALVALGAQFSFKAARGMLVPITAGVLARLVIVPLLVLSIAFIFTGYRGPAFAALVALFGSSTAVSGSVMAAEMGGDKVLAGQLLFWTTCLSAVTIFIFVLCFRVLGAL
ncbi:MAG: AEC family transporter [Clostridiales bacterium]|jgi:predicted permease|nr:AEC family transporter [Clostridiales bacterium]